MLDAAAVEDRRVKIGVRRFIDQLQGQRQLVVSQLEMGDASEPLRLAVQIQSLDLRIAALVAAAHPLAPHTDLLPVA